MRDVDIGAGLRGTAGQDGVARFERYGVCGARTKAEVGWLVRTRYPLVGWIRRRSAGACLTRGCCAGRTCRSCHASCPTPPRGWLPAQVDRFPEPGMVLRPLHIEYTPELVDLTLLIYRPLARVDSQLNKSERRRPGLMGLDTYVDRGDISHRWLALQGRQVLWLRPLALAEDNQSLSWLPYADSSLEGLEPLVPTMPHYRSSATRPRARRSRCWSISGTAPNRP